MQRPLYLDYAATTPIDPRVKTQMCQYLDCEDEFGNPASTTHVYGCTARGAVERARKQVADLMGAQSTEIVWTSGATESDNLAIKGVCDFYKRKGRHIITSSVEHKAVIGTCRFLETQGVEVTYLTPDTSGLISPKQLEKALREETVLVSIMLVNNETGVTQDIKALSQITRARGVFFHVDAAQALGKTPIDVERLDIDLMSVSAHKVYGPKGIGALYVRKKPRVRLSAQMHGGGHEFGLRSGTLATHQIVGMGEACQLAKGLLHDEMKKIKVLRERLWRGIQALGQVYLNGQESALAPGILNVSFDFVEGESLLVGLSALAVSSGSACDSASLEPSYVLTAMGIDSGLAHGAIRFSIGRFTTEQDIDFALGEIQKAVKHLRALNPSWQTADE